MFLPRNFPNTLALSIFRYSTSMLNIFRSICCAFCIAALAEEVSAETLTVQFRAPIDGHIFEIKPVSWVNQGGVSMAQSSYDDVRERLSSRTLLAVGKDFDPPVFPRLYSQAGLVQNTEPVVHIESDNLSLQASQERVKLEVAKQELELLKKRYALEQALFQPERTANENDTSANITMAMEFKKRHNEGPKGCELPNAACLGGIAANRYLSNVEIVQAQRKNSFQDRQNSGLDELANRIKMAEDQYAVAKTSLDLIDATVALGKVVCPRKCKLVRVHVIKGQFVTKGQRLVELEIESD